jgi:hypothetical protein
MKTFNQLTTDQQKKAEEYALIKILTGICEGYLRFNDKLNGDGLQARIDKAGEKATAMQTPWFWHEYIMDTCADDLKGMARVDAEDALYPEVEKNEYCVPGIA